MMVMRSNHLQSYSYLCSLHVKHYVNPANLGEEQKFGG
jgi:hypothetical protein